MSLKQTHGYRKQTSGDQYEEGIGEEQYTIRYKINCKNILYNRENNKYFRITINGVQSSKIVNQYVVPL